MQWQNSEQKYGLVSKVFHWLSAIVFIGLFILGTWMVDLDYYSQWYKTAPHWHKSIGISLLVIMVLRGLWRSFTLQPKPLANQANQANWQVQSAHAVHILLYLLAFAIFVTGYLISTADGRGIEVFNWFSVPSLGEFFADQEDIAGEIHEILAFSFIGLVVLHALAAIKHHVIDKDQTLMRMIK